MIEFDNSKNAIINPTSFGIKHFPEHALIIYEDEYFERLSRKAKLDKVVSIDGQVYDDYLIYDSRGKNILILNPPDGAPTTAIMVEQAIASGVRSIAAIGSCGALDGSVKPHEIIVPTSAVRGEGTSYHYAPASDEIAQDPKSIAKIEKILKFYKLNYQKGKVWTTDALYRETKAAIEKMKALGCVAVDMECSALIAIAKFRRVKFAHILIALDNMDADTHEPRVEEYEKGYDQRIISAAMDILLSL